jgi:trans-aconitate methyltransferase
MTKDPYEWDAKLYQDSSSFQYKLGQMALDRLKPKDGERILDIGCGNAAVTIDLARQNSNGEVVAVEISEEMCNQARTNLEEQGITNVTVLHTDALGITFDREFDAVFSNSAIHWIQDLERMYALLHQSLKEGERLLIQTGLRESNPLTCVVIAMMKEKEFRQYFNKLVIPWRFLTVAENSAILEQCGFQNIVIEPFPFVETYDDVEGIMNYCRAAAMVPFLSVLPHDLQKAFVDRFREIWLAQNEGHELEMGQTRLFLHAEKE